MKRYFKFIIIAAAAVILILLIFYRLPYKFEKELTVCSLDGDVQTIQVEMIWQRYYTKPDELFGTAYFNGKIYYNLSGYFNEDGEFDSEYSAHARNLGEIFRDIKDKITSNGSIPSITLFQKKETGEFWEPNTRDTLSILFFNTSFGTLEVIETFIPDNENAASGIFYFGPATTAAHMGSAT